MWRTSSVGKSVCTVRGWSQVRFPSWPHFSPACYTWLPFVLLLLWLFVHTLCLELHYDGCMYRWYMYIEIQSPYLVIGTALWWLHVQVIYWNSWSVHTLWLELHCMGDTLKFRVHTLWLELHYNGCMYRWYIEIHGRSIPCDWNCIVWVIHWNSGSIPCDWNCIIMAACTGDILKFMVGPYLVIGTALYGWYIEIQGPYLVIGTAL